MVDAALHRISLGVFVRKISLIVYSVVNVLVEMTGLEPVTPCLQSRCSPN